MNDSRLTRDEFDALKRVLERFGTYGMLAFIMLSTGHGKQQIIKDCENVGIELYVRSMGLKTKLVLDLED